MALKNWGAIALTGGVVGALDAIDGAELEDQHGAFVITESGVFTYRLDADSGLAESPPDIIAPDANAGDKRWILEGSGVPQGTISGDIIRFNATTGYWESSAEPIEFKGIRLIPTDTPLSTAEGSVYYKSADQSVYVSTG